LNVEAQRTVPTTGQEIPSVRGKFHVRKGELDTQKGRGRRKLALFAQRIVGGYIEQHKLRIRVDTSKRFAICGESRCLATLEHNRLVNADALLGLDVLFFYA